MSIAEDIQFNQRLNSLHLAHTEGMIDADLGKPYLADRYKDPELQKRYEIGFNKVKAMQREQARERLTVGR